MKKLTQKLLTTSLAAVLLAGGSAVVLRGTALADNTGLVAAPAAAAKADKGAASDLQNAKRDQKPILARSLVKKTAALLNTDEKTMISELKTGKTLAQIAQEKANMSEDTLVQKLTGELSSTIDARVQSGKLTQDKANKLKAQLSDKVKKAVEKTVKFPKTGKPTDYQALANLKELSAYLGLTEADLKAKLKAGQSLAEIAKQQGISEDQLIAKIKDGMTDRIKKFVEHSHKPSAASQTSAAPAQ